MTVNNLLPVLSQQLQLNSVGHRQRDKKMGGGLVREKKGSRGEGGDMMEGGSRGEGGDMMEGEQLPKLII